MPLPSFKPCHCLVTSCSTMIWKIGCYPDNSCLLFKIYVILPIYMQEGFVPFFWKNSRDDRSYVVTCDYMAEPCIKSHSWMTPWSLTHEALSKERPTCLTYRHRGNKCVPFWAIKFVTIYSKEMKTYSNWCSWFFSFLLSLLLPPTVRDPRYSGLELLKHTGWVASFILLPCSNLSLASHSFQR